MSNLRAPSAGFVREGLGRAALLDNAGEVVELVGETGEQPLSPDLVVHRLDLHRHDDALFGGFQVDVGLEFVRRDVWYEVDEGGVGESVRPALDQYQAAIEVEQADARTDPQWASRRTLRLQRTVAARPTTVWRYWTDADLIRRWWSPEHFTAVECEAKAAPGGLLRIVMAEGDSTRHTAVGRYLALEKPRALSFELGPPPAS